MPSLEDFNRMAQQVDLFQKLRPDDIAKIFSKGMTLQIQKGNVIFHQGTTGNTMYVILAGKVQLYDHKKPIATLGTGDMLGEMALISEEPRSATAVAAENTHLFMMNEQLFHRLMTKRVAIQILLNVIGALCRRLRDMNHKLARLQEDN